MSVRKEKDLTKEQSPIKYYTGTKSQPTHYSKLQVQDLITTVNSFTLIYIRGSLDTEVWTFGNKINDRR